MGIDEISHLVHLSTLAKMVSIFSSRLSSMAFFALIFCQQVPSGLPDKAPFSHPFFRHDIQGSVNNCLARVVFELTW